jgi:hypothetical protein
VANRASLGGAVINGVFFRLRTGCQWLIERHGYLAPSQARLDFAAAQGVLMMGSHPVQWVGPVLEASPARTPPFVGRNP